MRDAVDPRSARLKRAEERKERIVAHRSSSFAEAEQWDLAYWQALTPQDRLSALVAIRADVEKVEQARRQHGQHP